jgi:hypothetical protein
MASVGTAPQLSPVRQLAPIDLSSPVREVEIEALMKKMRRAKIMESTLESGAPETKEEAAYVLFPHFTTQIRHIGACKLNFQLGCIWTPLADPS